MFLGADSSQLICDDAASSNRDIFECLDLLYKLALLTLKFFNFTFNKGWRWLVAGDAHWYRGFRRSLCPTGVDCRCGIGSGGVPGEMNAKPLMLVESMVKWGKWLGVVAWGICAEIAAAGFEACVCANACSSLCAGPGEDTGAGAGGGAGLYACSSAGSDAVASVCVHMLIYVQSFLLLH